MHYRACVVCRELRSKRFSRSKLEHASATALILLVMNEGKKEGKAYVRAIEAKEANFELLFAAVEYFGQ
jgi:hypothetical protein